MNILFTSSGRRGYLLQYFKDALNGAGKVHAINSDPLVPSAYYADVMVKSPPIYSDEYIPFLLHYCKVNEIGLLIPLFDPDLPVLAAHRSAFESLGTKVLVSSSATINVCNDKWETYRYLQALRIGTPRTFLKISDFEEARKQGWLDYPVIVKPRWGMGSLSVYKAENHEELEVFYKRVVREISSSYLRFESAATPDHSVIIQEFIAGKEYGLDVINDLQGKHVTTVVKRKLSMRLGGADMAETVFREDICTLGHAIASHLRHIGNLDMDVICDEKDRLLVLEMNARIGGGYPFSHVAGVNLPNALIAWCRGDHADIFAPAIGVIGMQDINIIGNKSV